MGAATLVGEDCQQLFLEEMLRRDSLFIVLYGVTLGYLCLWGANNFRSQKMRVAGLLVGETLELLRRSVEPGMTTKDLDELGLGAGR